MNKARRNTLANEHTTLAAVRAALDSIDTAVTGEKDAEREAFDNLPEGLRNSTQGQDAIQAAEYLETATDALTEALNQIDEALAAIEDAMSL